MPVWRSMMGSDLKYTSREFRSSLSRGSLLIVLASTLHVLTFFGMMAMIIYFAEHLKMTPPGITAPWFLPLLYLVPNVLGFAGYWIYSAPAPGTEQTESTRSWRRVVRATVLIQFGGVLIQVLLSAVGFPMNVNASLPLRSQIGGFAQLALLAIMTCVWLLQIAACVGYTAELAHRLPDAPYAQRIQRLFYWLPAWTVLGMALVIGPLVAVAMYCRMLLGLRTRLQTLSEP